MTPYLPPHEPRCRPGCTVLSLRDTCARFLAPLPQAGAVVVDHALLRGDRGCTYYLATSKCTVPVPTSRRVHPGF